MLSLTSEQVTPYHRWPAGPKLLAVCIVTAVMFSAGSIILSGIACLLLFGLYAVPGRAFLREGVRGFRVLWPFLALIALWHGITGTPLAGVGVALQLLAAVGFANLVTMTSRLDDLADAVTRAASPLRRLGVRPHRFGLALALVVRFTPVLGARGAQLAEAWRARAPRRVGWQVLAPLALAAIDDADHVAEALRARGGIDASKE
ncbi:MAG: energy-coupling factor transporter transmembrane protein EcfT [Rhodobacteraceae bacterium]|nr:energy-coupling factor transporter transmembrane protein EcfT [Paracoccaceae bacterium]